MNINIIVVVIQLIKDIERRIETCIADVGIQATAGIHSEAEGVDIEITLHLTSYNVNTLMQRTRSLLITERALSSQLCSQVLQDII